MVSSPSSLARAERLAKLANSCALQRDLFQNVSATVAGFESATAVLILEHLRV